jgi:hypothetical protein
MLVAITENRGGANGGPQYSPMNVNPLGGNGQSGNIDYTGFEYGMNKQINEARKAEPIKAPSPRAFPTPNVAAAPIVTLDSAPLDPTLPMTAGARLGLGAGEEALGLPAVVPGKQIDTGVNALRAMYMQDPNNQDLRRMLEFVEINGAV